MKRGFNRWRFEKWSNKEDQVSDFERLLDLLKPTLDVYKWRCGGGVELDDGVG